MESISKLDFLKSPEADLDDLDEVDKNLCLWKEH